MYKNVGIFNTERYPSLIRITIFQLYMVKNEMADLRQVVEHYGF